MKIIHLKIAGLILMIIIIIGFATVEEIGTIYSNKKSQEQIDNDRWYETDIYLKSIYYYSDYNKLDMELTAEYKDSWGSKIIQDKKRSLLVSPGKDKLYKTEDDIAFFYGDIFGTEYFQNNIDVIIQNDVYEKFIVKRLFYITEVDFLKIASQKINFNLYWDQITDNELYWEKIANRSLLRYLVDNNLVNINYALNKDKTGEVIVPIVHFVMGDSKNITKLLEYNPNLDFYYKGEKFMDYAKKKYPKAFQVIEEYLKRQQEQDVIKVKDK